MAEAAVANGEYERGAELLDAAAARRRAMGMPVAPVATPGLDQIMRTLRVQLSSTALADAWDRGGSRLSDGDDRESALPDAVRSP
jgi:hypothetical protein